MVKEGPREVPARLVTGWWDPEDLSPRIVALASLPCCLH